MKEMTTTDSPSNTSHFVSNLNSTDGAIRSLQDSLGIDKMKIAFPIAQATAVAILGIADARMRASTRPPRSPIQIGSERYHLYVGRAYFRRDGTAWANVEFNPSRWNDPEGWTAVPVGDLTTVLNKVWTVLHPTFRPTVHLSEARVRRLDIARDFKNIESPEKYLQRMDTNARAFRHLHRGHHASPQGGWTISLSNRSGGRVILYDKHAQTRGVAPQGTLRFEIQMRGWLRNHGSSMFTVADVTAQAVESAARHWWDASRFGIPLVPSSNMLAHIQTSVRGSRNASSIANATYAYYLRGLDGDESLDIAASTRRRYQSILQNAEVLAMKARPENIGHVRLDLDTGLEVVANA